MASNQKKSGCGSCLFKTFLIVFVVVMLLNFLENGSGTTSKPINTTPNYTTNNNQNNNQQNNQTTNPTTNQTTNPTTNQTTNQTTGNQTQLPEDSWIEAQLDETERKLYDSMVAALAEGKLECKVDGIEKDNLKKRMERVVRAVTHEHPEFFWYEGSCTYSTRTSLIGNTSITMKLGAYDYWLYTSDAQGYIDRLNSRISEVVALAQQYPTQYEQALFVHDYIVSTVDYNHEAAAETTSTVRKASSEQSYSAYGCLVNRSAVCGGYSKAYQMIMTALGIECIYIKGDAGGLHSWNCIKLDDEYYLIDSTWDDPGLTYSNGTLRYPEGVTYTYFGVTNEQMDKTHTPNDSFSFPICTATKYNYYKQEGLYFETFDMEQVDAALKKQAGKEIIGVSFSESAFAEAKAKLIDQKGYSKLEALKNQRFAYGADEKNLDIEFYLNYK